MDDPVHWALDLDLVCKPLNLYSVCTCIIGCGSDPRPFIKDRDQQPFIQDSDQQVYMQGTDP